MEFRGFYGLSWNLLRLSPYQRLIRLHDIIYLFAINNIKKAYPGGRRVSVAESASSNPPDSMYVSLLCPLCYVGSSFCDELITQSEAS
jgi:hypothetical protein